MYFTPEDDGDYEEESTIPTWNVAQFILSIFCTLSIGLWFRLPTSFFFGSGWTIIGMFFFLILIAPPLIYLQIRLGCQFNRGFLSIYDKFFPLSLGFGIGAIIRNLISVIYVSALMSLCLSYIFFSIFPCDGKYCVEAKYMWQACENTWSREGACMMGRKEMREGPTEEEKFFFNFAIARTESIRINDGFPIWFEMAGLNIVPHLLAWLIFFFTVIGGAKVFGWILYFVIPPAFIILLAATAIFHLYYADERGLRDAYMSRFFTNFAGRIPLSQTAFDQYKFEPTIWGLLSTFIHLSMAFNLWNGVYPIMGKWVGNGKMRRHVYWLFLWIPFGLFAVIPTVLFVAALASTYSADYLRCPISLGWAMPFTLIPHIFSKFSSHKILAALFFFSLFIFLLMSQALLFITSIENIVDHLRHWHTRVTRNQRTVYCVATCIAIFLFIPLSFPQIIKSGFYWISLVDHYLDRFMCVLIVGQGLAYLFSYARSKTKENKFIKLYILIHFAIALFISVCIFVWYTVDTTSSDPSEGCKYQKKFSPFEPVGWIISISPPLLGILVALPLIWCHSRRHDAVNCCAYFIKGEKAQNKREKEEHLLMERSQPSTMSAQPMRNTLRSGASGGGQQQNTLSKYSVA